MKARNPSTGTLETVYVKALDSMPVGTEVDFDGTSADIPTGWEQITDPSVYSTNEIVIGTWIDGRPIYRKTFESSNFQNGQAILTGIRWVVNSYGLLDPGTGIQRQIPYYEVFSSNHFCARVHFRDNQVQIDSYSDGQAHSCSGKITVEYTKLSD